MRLSPKEEPVLGEIQQTVLDPQVPIVTLVGAAGVGKTALAFLNQLPRPSKALVTSRERVGLLAQERVSRTEPAREGPVGLELFIQRGPPGQYTVSVEGEFSHASATAWPGRRGRSCYSKMRRGLVVR